MTDPRHERVKKWVNAIRKVLGKDEEYLLQAAKLVGLRTQLDHLQEQIFEEQDKLGAIGNKVVGAKAYNSLCLYELDCLNPHPYPTEEQLEAFLKKHQL